MEVEMSMNAIELLTVFASIKSRGTAIQLLLVLMLLLNVVPSYSQRRVKETAAVASAAPTLNGGAAVEYLKQQGLYPVLAAAVKEARSEFANDDPYCGYEARQLFSALDGSKDDGFGTSVAVDGDTIVVGVPDDTLGTVEFQGTAYVFVREGDRWKERARLFPSDGAPDDSFGWSVAISGQYIVVGAPGNNIGAITDQGAAYVYFNNGGSWVEQQRLLATDGAARDRFGTAVAISGEQVAVGAQWADINGRVDQGAVYRFRRSGSVWAQEAKLTAEDGAAGDLFGCSVALAGAVLIVGAEFDDIGSNVNQGSAYIFGDSAFPTVQKLIASDGAPEDSFGVSVAIDGGTALVGAPFDQVGVNKLQGSAYVFVRGGTRINPAWLFQSKLTDQTDGGPDDLFGVSVALRGDLALVGASQISKSGKALLYSRSGTVWTMRQPLGPIFLGPSDRYGCSVALGQDELFIGSSSGGNVDQGIVYFYESFCMATVSAASYDGTQQAPESIVAGFGRHLAVEALGATELPLPTILGDTQVRVFDSLGTRRFAPLFYVSPGQINFQIPAGTALGEAQVVVNRNGIVAAGRVVITSVAPGLFTANSTGAGVPAALAFRLKGSGAQSYEAVASFDSAFGRFVPVPIDLGPNTDQVFLVLYGTGIRYRSSLANVSATIGGLASEVLAAEPAMGFVGLDQVNVRLSRALAGRGEVDVSLSVDGRITNTVRINVR
jgi:uncharacterized protein (TIGR03437 family)